MRVTVIVSCVCVRVCVYISCLPPRTSTSQNKGTYGLTMTWRKYYPNVHQKKCLNQFLLARISPIVRALINVHNFELNLLVNNKYFRVEA